MTKPIELIYSQQVSDFVRGKAYANPRFYSTPRAGASKVYLVGDWPKIRADYEALGVPVEQVELSGVTANAPPEAGPIDTGLVSALSDEERAAVKITAEWEALKWPNLRQLAAQFSAEPVLNKAQAAKVVEAELARRAAVVATEDEPVEVLPETEAEA